mmetsp:Transcript_19662/g.58249  ORF Transcript_19662/g.58249 Transcript_19662/m.58249 type:complete len:340 (-) Transcript_19662:230-1249(-)
MSSLDRPLRVALIGAGRFAEAHARELRALQDAGAVVVTHVYSRSAPKAKALAATLDAQPAFIRATADDLDAILDDPTVDAVDVVLPICAQLAVVRRALAAGKYVLSEKPIGPDVAAAEEFLEAARRRGADARWAVAEQYRLEPAVEALAKIGDVRTARLFASVPVTEASPDLRATWRAAPEHEGGWFGDVGVHYVAALRAAVGARPQFVQAVATSASDQMPPPDAVVALVEFPDAVVATLHVSFHYDVPERFELAVDARGEATTLARVFDRPGYELRTGAGPPEFYATAGVRRELEAFVAAARAGGPVPAALSAAEALLDLEIVEAILNASASGRKVAV